jgi:hypothetical protein
MPERLLEAFREAAEHSTPMPDFDAIAAAGRRRRNRRHAVVGAAAACVLGASGLLAAYDGSAGPDPAGDTDRHSLGTPYPTMSMTPLDEGAYALQAFEDPALPRIRLTLPPGMGAWHGPARWEGMGDGASNDAEANREALESNPEWLLSMLVLDLQWIAQDACTMTDVRGDDLAATVEALRASPRLEVASEPVSTTRSGYPALHLRLRERGARGTCLQDSIMTTAQGGIGYLGRGTTYDAWLVDVGDKTLLLWAGWTAATPDEEVADLLEVVDSAEVLDP